MEGYLRRFQYRFGPEELQGLARFESLLGEHGLLVAD
jgi:predicted solute-binding protein